MADSYDVIAAFADGERVTPDALKAALAEPAGRDYLVDVLTLRDLVHRADAEVEVVVRRPARLRGWLGLAALVTVSVIGGYAAGQQRDGRTANRAAIERPATLDASPMVAPPPTRVITFEPGVNWEESIGG